MHSVVIIREVSPEADGLLSYELGLWKGAAEETGDGKKGMGKKKTHPRVMKILDNIAGFSLV